jgi:hypothetical protein
VLCFKVLGLTNTLEVEQSKRDDMVAKLHNIQSGKWWVKFRIFRVESWNEEFSHSISVKFLPQHEFEDLLYD